MKPLVITSVLAPTDLSDSSIPALRYARLFADRFSAKLTVMYTVLFPRAAALVEQAISPAAPSSA